MLTCWQTSPPQTCTPCLPWPPCRPPGMPSRQPHLPHRCSRPESCQSCMCIMLAGRRCSPACRPAHPAAGHCICLVQLRPACWPLHLTPSWRGLAACSKQPAAPCVTTNRTCCTHPGLVISKWPGSFGTHVLLISLGVSPD